MYFLDDKKSYYKAIQRMLGVNQSGKWDKATIDAIYKTLRERDIEWNGVLDNGSFDILRDIYRDRARTSQYLIPQIQLTIGEGGEGVEAINSLLSSVIRGYTVDLRAPKGRFISHDSIKAAKYMRQVYLLDDKDYIDSELIYYLNMDIGSNKAK